MRNLEIIDKAKIWIAPRVQNSLPAWYFLPRSAKFRAYCVGAPKTGTTTISLLFQSQYRSTHEAEASLVLEKILNFIEDKNDQKKLVKYIRHRDRRLDLEMDSSHLNYPLVDIFLKEYEDAKFILTIRDCYSWLDSLLNHHAPIYQSLGRKNSFQKAKWTRFYNYMFGAQTFKHTQYEDCLLKRNLYTLDGYLSYWANHNNKIISTIPKEKLIVIKTHEINKSSDKIEDFLGLSRKTLNKEVIGNVRHSDQKLNLMSKINQDFLEEKVNFHCKELMQEFFPEVNKPKDARIGVS